MIPKFNKHGLGDDSSFLPTVGVGNCDSGVSSIIVGDSRCGI